MEPWVDAATPAAAAAKFWLSRAKLYPSATRTAASDALWAADVFRKLGDRERLFDALTNAASQFAYAGDFAAAENALAEAKSLLEPQWPGWTMVAFALVSSGVKYWSGDTAEARRRLRAALDLSRGDGDASQTEWIEMMLVGCDVASRNSCDVLHASAAMLDRDSPPMGGFNRAVVESFRGAALVQMGELENAGALFQAAFPRIRRALGTAHTTLCHFAFLLARRGRYADAARLLGAVEALHPAGAAILAPPNRASYDEAAVIVEEALDAAELARLMAEGSMLSEDEAVAVMFADNMVLGGRAPDPSRERSHNPHNIPSHRHQA